MICIAVIGYGYWGPRVARSLCSHKESKLAGICDERPEARARAQEDFPNVQVSGSACEVLRSTAIDAVAIVTPVWTHYELAKKALLNGKHVFLEKPFTSTAEQAQELIELAAQKNLTVMVDHTFLFTGAVRKIRELIDDGTLGDLYYYDSTRVNLGLFQHDVNVVWDLAPHDLSIMDFLIRDSPEAVLATGSTHLNGHEDVAYITVYYPRNVIAHISVNWLSPVKVRTTLVGGEKKMLVWNDLEPDEKIKVYDKGVKITNREGVYDLLVNYRSGDMWAPRLDQSEALKVEGEQFIQCIISGQKPINDGAAGHRVVRMLEAATRSIKDKGKIVYL